MFTQDEVAKRAYEKAEKFRRDQAAQLEYADAEGEKRGLQKGIEQGIVTMISTLKGLNFGKETIAIKLMEGFGLDDKSANKYIEANW